MESGDKPFVCFDRHQALFPVVFVDGVGAVETFGIAERADLDLYPAEDGQAEELYEIERVHGGNIVEKTGGARGELA